MSIKTDKDNNDVLVVDTLSDLLGLLSQQGVQVKISDTSKLRDLDIEESFEGECEFCGPKENCTGYKCWIR
mgnify:FL=1